MRSEADVNAHEHAIRAAARARANGKLQEILHARPVDVDTEPETWWKRWFKWETLTVAGRTIEKGWVVPQGLGIALIIFILGFAGTLHWRVTDAVSTLAKDNQDMRILLNRLDERSQQDDKHRREDRQELKQEIDSLKSHQAAVESVWNKQFSELKAQQARR